MRWLLVNATGAPFALRITNRRIVRPHQTLGTTLTGAIMADSLLTLSLTLLIGRPPRIIDMSPAYLNTVNAEWSSLDRG